ncbi:MAG: 30S ribosomal protein S1 [Bacteroidales bacterium]|nr:30S ribosomal protein S1 [Bacteroidales bacterium]
MTENDKNEEVLNEDVQNPQVSETQKETQKEKAEEVKAEETPVKEEKTEELKAEETPAKEEKTEEVKAEETPVKEEKIEEVKAEKTSESKPQTSNKEEIKPLDDFNWDLIGKKDDTYSQDERAKLEDVYNNTFKLVMEGEVVDGTIVAFNKREVVVNIGYKSEGIINANEFRNQEEIKVGDVVDVYVENMESIDGQLILSHKKAQSLKSWERVNVAHDKDEIVNGYIKCRTKGGMIVDIFGIEAFLPGSQIDVKPIRDYDIYVGKTMEFKVVKINEEFKNVVVSHKALIEAELEEQKKHIISKLEKGQVLEGTVKNITSYGVFIDLGGVDGLIHITDLSWGRVTHPEEIVELDSKIQVVILDFDDDKKRIALGLKQLTPHPWDALDENLKIGDKVKGKVVVLADYGAFVEINTGVEGLIHVSEMSWSQHLRSAQEFMKVGDEVEAVILTLDREERKMSLGIKQLHPDPWENIETKYPVSSKHKSKVRNFTNFGVFVELEEGVDGLVHISDLSWTKKIKHPAEFTSIDAELEVVVLEIDKENRRLSLGHKQIEENPWEVFETIFTVDSIHEGTIIEMNEKGSIIALPYGVEGFATPKHLVKEDGTASKIDEKLNFKVVEFNKDAKKIFVSHSRIHEDINKAQAQEERKSKADTGKSRKPKKTGDKIEKTTIGDVTDLAALKEELLQQEKKDKKDK